MKSRKLTIKLVAFLMALMMTILTLPIHIFASTMDDTTDSTETDTGSTQNDIAGVYVIKEDIALREENVKHFKLSDGTVKAVSYANPVHYLDENGNWIDIDNALTLSGNEYKTSNKTEIKFANKSGSNGLVSIKDGNYKIDFTPLSTNKVSVVIENPQSNNSRKFDDVKALNNLVSKATYQNIYNGIDFEYILVGNNIKENIIVKEKQDNYSYSQELMLNKLSATLDNGAIILSDYDTGEQIYKIPAPYMVDANGTYNMDVEYTLVQTSKWKYTLTVTANANWINNEATLPVKIDPTITANSLVEDTFVMAGETDDYSDLESMFVGKFMGMETFAFVRFNTIPAVPDGYVLSDAKATFLNNIYSDINLNIAIYECTANWWSSTNTLNYANASQKYNSEAPVDCINVTTSGIYEWNVTSLYKKWCENTSSNKGVCLKSVVVPTSEMKANLMTSENSTGYKIPQLEISYFSIAGVENNHAYFDTSLGVAGIGYINAYDGKLTLVSGITATVDEIMPYSIGVVYNSVNKTWIYSFDEYVSLASGTTIFEWRDADGTLHYFSPYIEKNYWGADVYYEIAPQTGNKFQVIEPTEFYDEDGLGLTLRINDNGEYIISDDKGNKKVFDSNGRLSYITDTFGNTRKFKYTNNNLSEISLIPNGLTEISQIKLTYESNALKTIINVQAKTRANIVWANDRISKIEHIAEHNEPTLVNTAEYEYDIAGRLTNAKDKATQKYICYEYTNGKVTKISEYGSDGVTSYLGQQATIQYDNYKTTFCDLGSESDTDDLLTIYMFDKKARLNTVYTCNVDETIIYGSSSYEYYDKHIEKNVGPKKHNKIKNFTQTGSNASNILNNPTFNVNTDFWNITGASYSVIETGNGDYLKSLRIEHSETQETIVQQELTLLKGKYTFSIYLNKYDISEASSIRLMVLNSQNQVIASTSYINRNSEATEAFESYWEKEEISFNISQLGTYKIAVEFETEASEKDREILYIDNAMLESGEGGSTHSIYENGEFSQVLNGVATNATIENSQLKLSSELTASASFEKNINIPSGISLDQWVISLWAKADNCIASANTSNSNAKFGIKIKYIPIGSTEQTEKFIAINSQCAGWQFFSKALDDATEEEEKIYTNSVTISLIYDNNFGNAYFDKISICQLGNGTSYQYNGLGNVVSSVDKNGNKIEYNYNSGNAYDVSSIDSQYNKTNLIYDSNHNITEIESEYSNNDKISEQYLRNSFGQITTTRTVNEQNIYEIIITENTYISSATLATFGKLNTHTDERGNVTKYFYTENGLLKGVCLNDDKGTLYEYDAYGQLIKVSLATYNSETNSLDYSTTRNDDRIEYSYNSKHELEGIFTSGTNYSFDYDVFGNLKSVRIDNDNVTTEELTEYILTTYNYEEGNGNLTSISYGNGVVVYYLYDNLDRVIGVCYNENTENSVIYTYSSNGQISSIYDADNSILYKYSYDGNGKLINEKAKKNNTVLYDRIYKYDEDGRLTNESLYSLDNHSNLISSTNYVYDSDNRLQRIINSSGESIEYAYDVFGRIYSKTSTANDNFSLTKYYNYVSTINTTTGYISDERIIKNGTQSIGSILYTYDERGNITRIVYETEYEITYEYDDKNQLIRENNSKLGHTYLYSYDFGGNLRCREVRNYTQQPLSEFGDQPPLYMELFSYNDSSWGDLRTGYSSASVTSTNENVSGTTTYDGSGNPITYFNGNNFVFAWEKGRQLASATINGTTYEYKYNQDGIRIEKSSGNKKYEYTLNGNQISRELVSTNGTINKDSYFYYDANGIISSAKILIYTPTVVEYNLVFSTNMHGDVYEIFNSDGTSIISIAYNAWGEHQITYKTDNITLRTLACETPFRYRGYFYDSETGLYYLNSRYYDAKMCRFINADETSYLGANGDMQGFNLYAYCSNNPVEYIDPIGERIIKDAIKWLGAKVVKPVVNKVQSALDKVNFTYTGGYSANMTPTIGSLGSQLGITIDSDGNVAIQGTMAVGLTSGGAGMSVSRFDSFTNAPNYRYLEKEGYQFGGSYGFFIGQVPVTAGLDANIIPSQNNNYYGLSPSFGIGGSTGFELHMSKSYTSTILSFNVFEIINNWCKRIEEW